MGYSKNANNRDGVLGISGSHGLTVPELLICLALVLVIAILTIPLFGHARSDAHRSNCINNIHQCGMAIVLYAEDYDNYYPTYRVDAQLEEHKEEPLYWHDKFCRATQASTGQPTWVSVTRSYTGMGRNRTAPSLTHAPSHDDMYHCPADEKRDEAATSYEYKMWLATYLAVAEVHVPGATIMLWEQWGFHDSHSNRVKCSEYDRRAELNVVFADQHAVYLPLAQTINARYGRGPNLHWLPSDTHVPVSAGLPAMYAFQDIGN